MKKGLGKGLNALISYVDEVGVNAGEATGVLELDIKKITPNREQPRKHFDQEMIEELAGSIKEYGIIQPIIVRPDGDNYIIIAGERRWRAAHHAGIELVPAVVRDCTDLECLEIALVENVQREDLNPIEEANCYKNLHEVFNLGQEEIAQKVGKSRSHIANLLRLLRLDVRVQELVVTGVLTVGHAKAILPIENNDIQHYFAKKIVEDGLNVREAEEFVRKYGMPMTDEERSEILNTDGKTIAEKKDKYVNHQMDLRGILGTRVNIRDNRTGSGGGKIEINYFTEDDLNRIVDIIRKLKK